MTKKELAAKIAEHHKAIKPEIDTERYIKVLTKKMTTRELELVVNGLNK